MSALEPRSDQLEMLALSKEGNIIVAMPTGSGKTYVASMVITEVMKTCKAEDLVWFLTPTKLLCEQQLKHVSQHMPAVSMTKLTGDDGVEFWKAQEIWDTALEGNQVVFSTYAVLADALSHGFVRLGRLALIVFDEAHNCRKGHPGCQIMRHYHAAKLEGEKIPKILGLSASIDAKEIRGLEQTLDAACRSPVASHHAMMDCEPERSFTQIFYSRKCCQGPCILDDWASVDVRDEAPRKRIVGHGAGFPEDTKLRRQACTVWEQIGPWGLHKFLTQDAQRDESRGRGAMNAISCDSPGSNWTAFSDLSQRSGGAAPIPVGQRGRVSDKAEKLLSHLQAKAHTDFVGIIFVRERVTAFILAALINTHPKTRDLFQSAACVGSSSQLEDLYQTDLEQCRRSADVIHQLCFGRINLIVATSVLEEGMDIPACHFVISFDLPANLKSFIQRRGRARKHPSEFAVMVPDDDDSFSSNLQRWDGMERDMRNVCMDHSRQTSEGLDTMSEEILDLRLDTGALLTSQNSVPHLYHFCATACNGTYPLSSPTFSLRLGPTGELQSTVYLPSGVDRTLGAVKGLHWWNSKRRARQDAAFQAVCLLHKHHLIDDHLLPLFPAELCLERRVEGDLPAEIPCVDGFETIWRQLPGHWLERKLYRFRVMFTVDGRDQPDLDMAIYMPFRIRNSLQLNWAWDHHSDVVVTVDPLTCNTEVIASPDLRHMMRKASALFLFSTRTKSEVAAYSELMPFFSPDVPLDELEEWLAIHEGSVTIPSGPIKIPILCPQGLVRSQDRRVPQVFLRWRWHASSGELLIQCKPLRRELCGQSPAERCPLDPKSPASADLPAAGCAVDHLPWELSRASLAIPTIIQGLQRQLKTQNICDQLLHEFPQMNSQLIARALTAPSSKWPDHYQRLEFFGDSILKFCVSTCAFNQYPLWPEGYLSRYKARMVSNATLINAAVRVGLEQFICADCVTRRDLVLSGTGAGLGTICVSGKVYADVVEALIAAAYQSAGLPLSRRLVEKFLPEISSAVVVFAPPDPLGNSFPVYLEQKLDKLLGYCFRKRSLLWEALTHPSWQRDNSTGSYQRLEFLGDAVLEFLVSRILYNYRPDLSECQMTEARAAVVNADFLAFLCMGFILTESNHLVQHNRSDGAKDQVHDTERALWMFMRHDAPEIIQSQDWCNQRYHAARQSITTCLRGGESYPWAALARLGLSKFYSDLIESVIGALFIDGDGDGALDTCQHFMDRIGMTSYLVRFLKDKVRLEHPKNTLIRLSYPNKVDWCFSETAAGLHNISICIDGAEVALVADCSTKRQAEVRGADAAIAFLSQANQ